ncbi:MAG: protein translocase subunit SecF [Thermoanaerobaculia bacterium]|nr:protein translocase subunit SecF [Thermoanaerobaculia bacterium]
MEILRNPKIDFMRYRGIFVAVSAVMIILSVLAIFVHGRLNLGIDFAGGTQVTVKFAQPVEIDELRALVLEAGVDDAQIQQFGEEGSHEVIIKTPTVEGTEEGSRERVLAALEERYPAGGANDLNRIGHLAVGELLLAADPDGRLADDGDTEAARAYYENVGREVLQVRRDLGLISDFAQLESAEGVSDAVVAELRRSASLGELAVLGSENVGPQIGRELRGKGIAAVVLSLLGMLAYIWFRFELRFGIGALVAVFHDVMIVLGFYAWAEYELNLTTIAAFLTLVGYSVNDTVVVFDRVRENLRRKRRVPLVETMNQSINQTLSRTILTSGTTLLAVGSLLFIGGDVLRGFAFILTVGVLVGTYSSIYVASPFTILWENVFGRDARSRRREARAA